jgi:hypothetical protein
MTIRDMVRDAQREMRDTPDLQPDRAAELLNRLSALLGNILDEQRVADHAYNVVLLAHLDSEEAASRAKIRAEITPEYQRKREARDTYVLAIELIRTLKLYVRGKTEELRAAGHMR